MLKFINSLATIEVNKEIGAIQVVFRGSGNVSHYLETLRMVTSFASLHHIHTYLLIKNEFDDVSCQQFYDLIEDWLYSVNQHVSQLTLNKVKVALLTSNGSCKELSERKAYHTSPQNYFSMFPALFSDKEKACHFLQTQSVNKSIKV